MNSRNENMILKLATDDDAATADVETVARQLIGRSVYAGWPHMCEVRVTAVSDGAFKYSLCESSKPARGGGGHKVKIDIQEQELDRNEATAWCREAEGIQDRCVSVTRLCRVTLGSLIYSVLCLHCISSACSLILRQVQEPQRSLDWSARNFALRFIAHRPQVDHVHIT